jgi:hypothetical protein
MCYIYVKLNVLLDQYGEERKKIHEVDVDPRLVPFGKGATYAAGRGLLHGRYVKVLLVFS